MTKKQKVIIIICSVIAAALGIFFAVVILANLATKNKDIDLKFYETGYSNIEFNKNNKILIVNINDRDVIINLNDKVIDENENKESLKLLYNDYYTQTGNGITTLKRNNKEITASTEKDQYLLVKDLDDDNSKYISIYYDTLVNDYSDKYKIAYYAKKFEAFLYNADTGEIIIDNALEIVPVLMGGTAKYFYIRSKAENVLFNLETEQLIELGSNYLISDEVRYTQGDFISHSSRYLVISDQNGKKGLINQNGDYVIANMYKEIFFKDDREDLIVAVNDSNRYGIINIFNVTKLEFSYDGIIVDNDYIILLKGNRIGILDKYLAIINDFLVPYNGDNFLIKETVDLTNSFNYHFKSGNLIISSRVIQDYNTYIISPYGLVNLILGEKPHITYSNLNNEYYIITEKIVDNILSLRIHDAAGILISIFEKTDLKNISNIKTEIIAKDIIKINYYDNKNIYLSSDIINPSNGQLITTDNNNIYGSVKGINDGYYEKIDGILNIYNSNREFLDSFKGEEIIYIKDNYYKIKLNDGYWYLMQMNI